MKNYLGGQILENNKWKIQQEQEFKFLQKLDLPADFFKGYVDEIMDFIEDTYGDKYRFEQQIEDPYIFNHIGEWEFIDWVKDKYGIFFGEEIRLYFS